MFRLYDQTRRRICIAGFVALCVLPTAAVLAWCAARHLPGHAAAEARRLSQRLGMHVSFDRVEYLRPGTVLYRGLVLADPESAQCVLRCRVLQSEWFSAGAQGPSKPTLVLIASQPEIETAGFERLGQLLGRVLRGETTREEFDVRLTAGEVTLRAKDRAETLTGFGANLDASADRTQAQVVFRLAGVDTPEPMWIRIGRNRRTTPPASSFELDTRGGWIPCDLLALGLPELHKLGSWSRFRGCIWARETAGAWQGELTAQLGGLELGRLVTDRFPHKLSGSGQVTIRSARFRRGRLEEASGTLTAGPGVISRSLIEAAAEQLKLVQNPQPLPRDNLLLYESLALEFSIDPHGLVLQGLCSTGGPGAVLLGRDGLLLSEPTSQPQPVVAVLRTLAPANELQVPATRETDWLMRLLPLAPLVPPEGSEPAAAQARVRLGDDVQ